MTTRHLRTLLRYRVEGEGDGEEEEEEDVVVGGGVRTLTAANSASDDGSDRIVCNLTQNARMSGAALRYRVISRNMYNAELRFSSCSQVAIPKVA